MVCIKIGPRFRFTKRMTLSTIKGTNNNHLSNVQVKEERPNTHKWQIDNVHQTWAQIWSNPDPEEIPFEGNILLKVLIALCGSAWLVDHILCGAQIGTHYSTIKTAAALNAQLFLCLPLWRLQSLKAPNHCCKVKVKTCWRVTRLNWSCHWKIFKIFYFVIFLS